jgi:NADP-dependent 3-hydroxy acid dehydrogenase YdfG
MMKKSVVLVVGASSGFGFELSKVLLEKNHIVYCAARRVEQMKPLADLGGHLLYMDVRDQKTIDQGVEKIIANHQKIDVVYNNAGYGQYGPVDLDSLERIQAMYDVNLFGAARVNHAVLKYMRKQKQGRIVITASLVSNLSIPGIGWYASSKHALRALVEALRLEVKPFHIDVIQIEPGAVKTGFDAVAVPSIETSPYHRDYQNMMKSFDGYIKNVYQKAPNVNSTIKAMLHAGFAKRPKWVYRTTMDAKVIPLIKQVIGLKIVSKVISKNYKSK